METTSRFTRTIASLIIAAVPFAIIIGIFGLLRHDESGSPSNVYVASTSQVDTACTTSGGNSSTSSHPITKRIIIRDRQGRPYNTYTFHYNTPRLTPHNGQTRHNSILSTTKSAPHHSIPTDLFKAQKQRLISINEMQEIFEHTRAHKQFASPVVTTPQSPGTESKQSPTNSDASHSSTPNDTLY